VSKATSDTATLSSPCVANGVVYFESAALQKVYALAVSAGAQLWSASVGVEEEGRSRRDRRSTFVDAINGEGANAPTAFGL
jgi:outer membrane protein assembly factor BamB